MLAQHSYWGWNEDLSLVNLFSFINIKQMEVNMEVSIAVHSNLLEAWIQDNTVLCVAYPPERWSDTCSVSPMMVPAWQARQNMYVYIPIIYYIKLLQSESAQRVNEKSSNASYYGMQVRQRDMAPIKKWTTNNQPNISTFFLKSTKFYQIKRQLWEKREGQLGRGARVKSSLVGVGVMKSHFTTNKRFQC